MIRSRDAFLLARTKLRVRPLRTCITIAITSLLFACLVFALFVWHGFSTSVDQFRQNGLADRYIVQIMNDTAVPGIMQDKGIQQRATAIFKQKVAEKQAAAKRLGIEYDVKQEEEPIIDIPEVSVSLLSLRSPAALEALSEWRAKHPLPGYADVVRATQGYHPAAVYQQNSVLTGTIWMQDGRESFAPDEFTGARVWNPFVDEQFGVVDDKLIQSFYFADSQAHGEEVPVIVPYRVAEKLLKLPELRSPTAEESLQRVQELQKKAAGLTFTSCYRNDVSLSQISEAYDALHEDAQTKKQRKIIYSLPDPASCGAAVVEKDIRTPSEKSRDARQQEFDRLFGVETEAYQYKTTFKVIGLSPNGQSNGRGYGSVKDIVQSVAGSSMPFMAIPRSYYDTSSLKIANQQAAMQGVDSKIATTMFGDQGIYYAEFSNADDARAFIDDKGCTTRSDGTCATQARPFMLNEFGSNSIALDELQVQSGRILHIAYAAISIIAILILLNLIGRALVDSRRETAIFRAVGANRFDIAQIYAWYVGALTACIIICSFLIGGGAAYIVNMLFADTLTAEMRVAFGGSDNAHLWALSVTLWVVVALVIVASVIAAIGPIVRNVRRNPLQDMREE